MVEESTRPGKIDRELIGEIITVGGHTIQPVAHLKGWVGGNLGANGGGGGGGGWVNVRPVEVVVREADGAESRVPIADATATAVRSMVLAALAVAGICLAIMAGKALVDARAARRTA